MPASAAAGTSPDRLRTLTLGELPPSAPLDRLRQRRAELGLPAGDDAALLIDPVTGDPVPADAVPLHLRRARTTRVSMEANGSICRGMLRHRYDSPAGCKNQRCCKNQKARRNTVKAVRLHEFHAQPPIDDVPEPVITGPLDVIVKIGGAGVCRTDLHIIEGQWDAAMHTPLPYILGHENAGWVHEVGSAVTNVAVGDTVILHPTPTCGLCRACRAGDDMHCDNSEFPGLSRDGGMAEYLLTSARACVKLDPQTQPKDVAALADAGITAYHAVRKAIPLLYPGTTCVVIGAGGLGHIGIQCLAALTATRIIVVDRNPDALKLAEQLGAHHTVVADGGQVDAVQELTGGAGANVVLDFVAEQGAENDGWAMTGRPAPTSSSATAARCTSRRSTSSPTERNIIGNIVGTYNDLAELMVAGPGRQGHPAHQDLPAGRRAGRVRRPGRGPGPRPGDSRPLTPARAATCRTRRPTREDHGQGTPFRRGSARPAAGRRRPAGRGGQVDARAQGPQRHPGEDHRLAGGHQRRRDDRPRDPPEGPVREHGRAAGQGSGDQDQRHRRRRHHHRHGASPRRSSSEGMQAIAAGANPVLVKRGIDMAVGRLVDHLQEVAHPVETEQDYAGWPRSRRTTTRRSAR